MQNPLFHVHRTYLKTRRKREPMVETGENFGEESKETTVIRVEQESGRLCTNFPEDPFWCCGKWLMAYWGHLQTSAGSIGGERRTRAANVANDDRSVFVDSMDTTSMFPDVNFFIVKIQTTSCEA